MAAILCSLLIALLLVAVATGRARTLTLQDLLTATARGPQELWQVLQRPGARELLNAKDEHGITALVVAAYMGDAASTRLLLDAGARVAPGSFSMFRGDASAPLGSVVELVARRSAMLIMLGTPFDLPPYLRAAQRQLSTSRPRSEGDAEVPDLPQTLELLVFRGGARPTEKAHADGADLARAAYFLDADIVDVMVRAEPPDEEPAEKFRKGSGRALVAVVLGISQLKHRLNRALLQQPRMAGRLFRDFYGFDVPSEQSLLSLDLHDISFQDTLGMVRAKGERVARSLLHQGLADPNHKQSRQSKKTALHQCAEHGLGGIAQILLDARANPNLKSNPLGRTALHSAVVHRSYDVASALLGARADTELRDVSGRSALDLATLLRWRDGQLLLGASPVGSAQACVGDAEVCSRGWAKARPWELRWRTEPPEDGPAVGDQSRASGDESYASCGIDVRNASGLSATEFIADYLSIRRPALFRQAARYMPAAQRWSNLRYLKKKAGSTQVSAVTIPYPQDFGDRDAKDTRQLTLGEYIDSVMGRVNSSSGTPLYVFAVVEREDSNFKKMLALVERDAAPHPPFLGQEPGSQHRLRFGNIQFGLGPAGSGAPQHYHTHAYASLFSGRKRWWFVAPPRSSLSRKHARVFAAEDTAQRAGRSDATSGAPLVCDQLPGDIVYVPTDWGHLTLNTEASVSISREFTWDGEETDSFTINTITS